MALPQYNDVSVFGRGGLTAFAPALIILAVAFAWSGSFGGVFIFDDIQAVAENPTLDSLVGALAPPPNMTVSGRPVANLTLAINFMAGGYDVFGYHLVNLAIHTLAALTLFGLLRRALTRAVDAGRADFAALSAALLWAVHPLTTSAVTYIVQRCESLASLFYLLVLYLLAKSGESRRPMAWLAGSVSACFLAMGSKEMAASAPVAALLYDRQFLAGSFGEALRRRKWYYLALGASWGLLAYLVVSTGNRTETAGLGVGYEWWRYAATQVYAIPHYLRLAVWPSPLVFDYGERLRPITLSLLPYAAVLAVFVAATVWALVKRHPAGFAGFVFFAVLAPSSSVITITTQTMAEHRMYLPLAAAIAVATAGVFAAWSRRGKPGAGWVAGGVAALAMALGSVTYARNLDYLSDFGLWKDTAAKAPDNYRAYEGMALTHFENRDYSAAFDALDTADRLKPSAGTSVRLATALLKEGKLAEAEVLLLRAVKRWRNAQLYNLTGVSISLQGRSAEALEWFGRAVAAAPDSEFYRKNLEQARSGN